MRPAADRLTAGTFDLLVIGGGIYGLTIASDAARRGLTVALVDAHDFGSGSSFNHLRTIHGGLRYLQHLDLPRARESAAERRTLARIAPQALRPMPFVLPLSRSLTRGAWAMRAGFVLDGLVAGPPSGVVPSLTLPPGRVLSREAAIERFPDLPRAGLTAAAVWYDDVMTEPDRLTWLWALSALEHGAVLANHTPALALLADGSRVVGARVLDEATGATHEIAARVTVNATGAAAAGLLAPLTGPPRLPLLRAINLVTSRPAGAAAIGGRSATGRNLFMVPWRGRALYGTWESTCVAAPQYTAGHVTTGTRGTTGDEVNAFNMNVGNDVGNAGSDVGNVGNAVADFLAAINHAFPSAALTRDDVTLVHRGLVPAAVDADGVVTLEGHEQVLDHAIPGLGHVAHAGGIAGLLTVVGTEYTTARAVAERVVDRIVAKLERPPIACRTALEPLPGGDLDDPASAIAALQADDRLAGPTRTHLIGAYGSRYREVVAIGADRPAWLEPLAADSPVIGAELVWAVRHEMATTLADAVIRRTPLGALGDPGETAVARAAAVVGDELGWSSERRADEMAAVRRFYRE